MTKAKAKGPPLVEEIEITLTLRPHEMNTPRGRGVVSPQFSKLLEVDWWKRAIFGRRGMRDPIPVVTSVKFSKRAQVALLVGEGNSPVGDAVGAVHGPGLRNTRDSMGNPKLSPTQSKLLVDLVSGGTALYRHDKNGRFTTDPTAAGSESKKAWVRPGTIQILETYELVAPLSSDPKTFKGYTGYGHTDDGEAHVERIQKVG